MLREVICGLKLTEDLHQVVLKIKREFCVRYKWIGDPQMFVNGFFFFVRKYLSKFLRYLGLKPFLCFQKNPPLISSRNSTNNEIRMSQWSYCYANYCFTQEGISSKTILFFIKLWIWLLHLPWWLILRAFRCWKIDFI